MYNDCPLVSVLIPVYNASQYLRECLDSIINQTYKNIEIICVDDGSQDTSALILEEYAKLDERIRISKKKNEGVVSARKRGINEATGSFILYVDADDWIDSNMIEEMVTVAISNDAEIVTSGCIHEYENHKTINTEKMKPGKYTGEALRKLFLSSMVSTDVFFSQNVRVTLWGKLYKKDFLKPLQLQIDNSIITGEDVAVVYPSYLKAKCIYVTGKNYYHYRINAQSMTSRTSDGDKKSLMILKEFLRKEFARIEDIPNLKEQCELILSFEELLVSPEKIITLKDDELYPFSSLYASDRIVLYGAGRFGKKVKGVLKDRGVNVIALIDKKLSEGVLPLSKIQSLDYDKVVVSVLNSDMISEMITALEDEGIKKNRISVIDVKKLKTGYLDK